MRWRMARALAATRPSLSRAILADLADDPLAGDLSSHARARLGAQVPATTAPQAGSPRDDLLEMLGVVMLPSEKDLAEPFGADEPATPGEVREASSPSVPEVRPISSGESLPAIETACGSVPRQPLSDRSTVAPAARAAMLEVFWDDLPRSKAGRFAFWSLLATAGLVGLVAASKFAGAPSLLPSLLRLQFPRAQVAAAVLAAGAVLIWRVGASSRDVIGGTLGPSRCRAVAVGVAWWLGCVGAVLVDMFHGSGLIWALREHSLSVPERLLAAGIMAVVVVVARIIVAVRGPAVRSAGHMGSRERSGDQGGLRAGAILAGFAGAALGGWLLVSAPLACQRALDSPAEAVATILGYRLPPAVAGGMPALSWVTLVLLVLASTTAAVALSSLGLVKRGLDSQGAGTSVNGQAAYPLWATASLSPLLVAWVLSAVALVFAFRMRVVYQMQLDARLNVRSAVVVAVAVLLILAVRRIEQARTLPRTSVGHVADGQAGAAIRSAETPGTLGGLRGLDTVGWLLVLSLSLVGLFSAIQVEGTLDTAARFVEMGRLTVKPPAVGEITQEALWVCLASVLFLVWVYRAARAAQDLRGRALAHSPAAAVGWFFVPVMNLWKPYEVLKEIRDVTLRYLGVAGKLRLLAHWWVLQVAIGLGAAFLLQWVIFSPDSQSLEMRMAIAGMMVLLQPVAAVLTVIVVVKLSNALHDAMRRRVAAESRS